MNLTTSDRYYTMSKHNLGKTDLFRIVLVWESYSIGGNAPDLLTYTLIGVNHDRKVVGFSWNTRQRAASIKQTV